MQINPLEAGVAPVHAFWILASQFVFAFDSC